MTIHEQQILVVDDEPQIRAIIGFVLESRGFNWIEAANANQAWSIFNENVIDLVMLDVMLPAVSGIELCKRLRAVSEVPIVLISALGDEEDRIRGLEAGADDYITKPFSPREVGLRVEAILRRLNTAGSTIEAEGLGIDSPSGEVTFGGQKMTLPAMEARVLEILIRNYNCPVTFVDLLNTVWNTSETVGGREMVRITIHRLRSHLRNLGVRDNFIESVRGSGYRIRKPPESHDLLQGCNEL
ncbi:MAG: two-component system response regulator [Actinomycetales bacterium]|nr:MAG: two-component system response regulator [Actinomycetales bacterium]